MRAGDQRRTEARIGHAGGDHVSIGILGRLHPRADDYWDGNWLAASVTVVAGSFHAEVNASLRAEEIRGFRESLEVLQATLSGEAALESMETWLTLLVRVTPTGTLDVRGTAVDQPGVGNELRFQIDALHQNDLPAIVTALREVEASYPVIGAPGT